MLRFHLAAALLVGLLLAVATSDAGTLYVPGDYTTIQDAIDAAVAGDIVEIADGTYTGERNKNLDFAGKAITVRSAAGDPTFCIIDCEDDGRGFYFHSEEGPDSVVSGLTITNGSASSSSPGGGYGGGILCDGASSPRIVGCVMRNNQAHAYQYGSLRGGGGIACGGNTTVSGCIIEDNDAEVYGGGISCRDSVTIIDCAVRRNDAHTYWDGDGVIAGRGGGVFCEGGATIVNSLVVGNTAHAVERTEEAAWGGGVYGGEVINCVVLNNHAEWNYYDWGHGGGVYAGTVRNSIVRGNGSDPLSGSSASYSNIEGGAGGVGNISADPLFVDESAGDYRLSPGSPCIDAADNTVVPPDAEHDLDGYSRFVDDPNVADTGNGIPPIVDMGAYEYQAVTLYVDADAPQGGDGSSWADASPFLQDALLAGGPGVLIKVAAGVYRPDESPDHPDGTGDRETSFVLPDGVRLLGGYAGRDADDPDERNPDLYETVLSGDLNGDDGPDFANYDDNSRHIVVADDSVSRTAILDGLTIRAGYADGDSADPWEAGGAGLLCDGADLIVNDCRFTANLTGRAGGALYTRDGTPHIVGCLFDDNAGGYGAALNSRTGHPRVFGCRFVGNASDFNGGAIANEASLALVNSLLTGNTSASNGGAVSLAGAVQVINTTITQNEAGTSGGGLYAASSTDSLIVVNSILWGNADSSGGDESAQLHRVGGELSIDYSSVQEWTGALGGEGNTGGDPLFVDEFGPDGFMGSGDENHQLTSASSCVDAGSNDAVPANLLLDLDGNLRFIDDRYTTDTGQGSPPLVDMGAYELRVGTPSDPCQPGSLFAEPGFDVGDWPSSVVLADLNNDGVLDAAVTNAHSDDLSILLGRGDGRFFPQQRFPAGDGPYSVVAADLNDDGAADLVVANNSSNDVSTLLGHGDGTFLPELRTDAGDGAISVAVADLDGDETLDVVVANLRSNDISILLGNGDGTFQSQTSVQAGERPFSVAVADFNEDGAVDLTTANRDSDDVSILLGNGDGTFQPGSRFPAGEHCGDVAAADFDDDGSVDLIVANRASDYLSLLRGNGDGTFQAEMQLPTGSFYGSAAVTAADLTGDGILDMAATIPYVDEISILVGIGDGTFQAPQLYNTGLEPRSIAVGDLDGDGAPDLVTANATSEDVSTLIGNGDGTFFQPDRRFDTGERPQSIATADFDGDGALDLAIANSGNGDVSILLGKGDGTLEPQQRLPVGGGAQTVLAADFDGDGTSDLAVGRSSSVSILLGNGDATFVAGQQLEVASGPHAMAAAVHEGAIVYLVVTNYNADTVSIFMANGDGTFQPELNYEVGNGPVSVTTGDYLGYYELPDVAVLNRLSGDVSVVLNLGGSNFLLGEGCGVGSGASSITTGDFDKNCTLDLVVARDNWVSVLYGIDYGMFQAGPTSAAEEQPEGLAAADFNGDGVLDLAVPNTFEGDYGNLGNHVGILLGNGDATFAAPVRYHSGRAPWAIAAADLNGDGAIDLAITNYYDDSVRIRLNNCFDACRGDLDGDGDTDQSDLGILLTSYDKPPDDPFFDPRADLDGDGEVGQPDLGILLADYLCGV